MREMIAQLKPAVMITVVFTVLTGIIYPLAVTGAAQVLFPHQANGSLVEKGGKTVGSELLGQTFAKSGYFHGRPSAAGNGYDAANSSGSNLGPTNPALEDRLKKDEAQFRKDNPDFHGALPADLLTTSGSGLDPDISPANAAAQVARVARARSVAKPVIAQMVARVEAGRQMGLLGEPRVNVLKLNMTLDAELPLR